MALPASFIAVSLSPRGERAGVRGGRFFNTAKAVDADPDAHLMYPFVKK